MGRDKASIPLVPAPDPGPTLASRSASLLAEVCPVAFEVGPGHTPLPAIEESPPGAGPLAALVSGWQALSSQGWAGPVLVVATDMPHLTVAMLQWLADRPGSRSVVPVSGGRVQPLCARYSPDDMAAARELVARGERAMMAFVDGLDADLPDEHEWVAAAGGSGVLDDVDTPADLRRMTGL